MCSLPGIASVGLDIYGNYAGQKATAAAAQAQMEAAAKAAITEMNYAFQNYEQERTDAFDAAVNEITKTRMNALQLNSGVRAAINENMSGRTANLLVRSAEGDTARAVASIQDNYDRKSNEIDLNKEATYLSTKATINNLNASVPKMPSRLTNALSAAGSALGVYTQVMNQKNDVLSSGQKYNWWTGGAKRANVNSIQKTYVGTVPLSVYQKTKQGTPQWR